METATSKDFFCVRVCVWLDEFRHTITQVDTSSRNLNPLFFFLSCFVFEVEGELLAVGAARLS